LSYHKAMVVVVTTNIHSQVTPSEWMLLPNHLDLTVTNFYG